ncbi:hypothetical protein [Legionella sp.]|uniref:hypothetical protein n=1 Tax=Legionella sp. TaxID=459 RepID=UPI003CB387B6
MNSTTSCQLIVQGTIQDNVYINWRGPIIFEKDLLGNSIRVVNHEGDITAKNLGKNTYLKIHKGNLSVDGTAEESKLENHNGNITVKTLLVG